MVELMVRYYPAKGQGSLEYILIVALTLVVIVPAAYLFYNYSRQSSEEFKDSQLTKIGRDIVDTAQSIFYSGQGSKTELDLNIPDNVISAVIIDSKELVFNVTTNVGITEIVFFSSVNITTLSSNCNNNICNLRQLATPGMEKLKIEATSSNVVTLQVI